jgi:hypothetical protein
MDSAFRYAENGVATLKALSHFELPRWTAAIFRSVGRP